MLDGDLDQAEKYYLQAIKCNSHNPTSMYHMGQVEARRGDYTKALTWLNHSLHINPNSSPAWNLQGELYLKQGNQPAAINSFKKLFMLSLKTLVHTSIWQGFTKEELTMNLLWKN